MSNPFSVSLGKVPASFIKREDVFHTIVESFEAEDLANQTYVLTGVRGSGKTVVLSALAKYFSNKKEWIVIDISTEENILHVLVGELALRLGKKNHSLSVNASVNLGPLSSGVAGEQSDIALSDSTLLDGLLQEVAKRKKRLLVTLDEVHNDASMRAFTQTYKNMLRKDYPVFLLMTGLYENVHSLEQESSMTFLFRAPKIDMNPLDPRLVSQSYAEVFHLELTQAIPLARFTKGYALAYQILGSLLFESGKTAIDDKIIDDFDSKIINLAYRIIYKELSEKEKRILNAMAACPSSSVADVLKALQMKASEFAPYRSRLIEKGILVSAQRGTIDFALPRFREFVYFYFVLLEQI